MKINFKSSKFWVVFAVSAAVLIALIITIIWFCVISAKLPTPQNLKCYKLSTGEIYVQVDENENAKAYEFKISKNAGPEQNIKSENAVINVSGYLSEIGEFVISCKILGQVNAANSNYCAQISYLNKINITAPEIELNKQENRLYFSVTDSYSQNVEIIPTLIYGVTSVGLFLQDTEHATIVSNNDRGAVSGYFDLGFLGNEEYSLCVKLTSNDEYILNSLSSQQLVYKRI